MNNNLISFCLIFECSVICKTWHLVNITMWVHIPSSSSFPVKHCFPLTDSAWILPPTMTRHRLYAWLHMANSLVRLMEHSWFYSYITNRPITRETCRKSILSLKNWHGCTCVFMYFLNRDTMYTWMMEDVQFMYIVHLWFVCKVFCVYSITGSLLVLIMFWLACWWHEALTQFCFDSH